MGIMEIVLLIAGGIVFVLSFLIPTRNEESREEFRGLAKEEIKAMISEQLDAVRGHVDDVVEEAITYSIEKTERSLERLSNEKIMAVNEYSDTVLEEIHKNHEEVMFLYDMLNDKHVNLKNTVSEINRTVKEAQETKKEAQEVMNTFQRLTPEVMIPIRDDSADIPREPVMMRESQAMAPSVAAQEFAMLQETVAAVSSSMGREPYAAKDSNMAREPYAAKEFNMGRDPYAARESNMGRDPYASRESYLARDPNMARETGEQDRNYNDQIMEMFQSGSSPVEIARELDLGVGEVKLVIDLHKNRSGK